MCQSSKFDTVLIKHFLVVNVCTLLSSHPGLTYSHAGAMHAAYSPVRYALKHKVLRGYRPAERDGFLGHTEIVLTSWFNVFPWWHPARCSQCSVYMLV